MARFLTRPTPARQDSPFRGFVLGSSKSSPGTRPPHHSAARTDVVLLIRRTVRPRGYAFGFDSPRALLDDRFERPRSLY